MTYKSRVDKKSRLDRLHGKPHQIPSGEAREIRDRLRAYGMTDARIAEQATENGFFIHATTVSTIGVGCYASTLESLRSVRPERVPNKLVPSIGTRRRLRGLVSAGYSQRWIATNVLYNGQQSHAAFVAGNQIIVGMYDTISLSMAEKVHKLTDRFEIVTPASQGVVDWVIKKSSEYARRHEWAPLNCWDDDTIDNPDAVPQYTGECGTVAGYRLHRAIGDKHWSGARYVLGCRACRTARSDFRYETGRNP